MDKRSLSTLTRYALVALPLVVAVIPHINLSPIWDGAIYAGCIVQSVSRGLDLWDLNCSHHPSVASLLPATLAYKFSGGALWSIHAANLLLALCAVWCFLGILDALFPDTSRTERGLAAACLAAMPAISASVLLTNSDHGTFVFSLVLLFALLTKRGWLIAIASAALPLTKEFGIAIWLLIVGGYGITAIARGDGTIYQRVRGLLSLWPSLTAPIAFWWYAAGRVTRGLPLLKPPRESGNDVFLSEAFNFSPFDHVLQSYLSSMFVLSFSWILTIIIVCGCVLGAVRWAFRVDSGGPRMRRELTIILFVCLVVLLTRFKTFTNVRYFLPVFPMTVLAAFLALRSLVPWSRGRSLILVVVLCLFEISAFRTVDPFSKKLFGTFMFGRHQILEMVSIARECCGRGRDQMAYNTEFTYLDHLTTDILADLRPTESFPVVIANDGLFYFFRGVWGANPPRRVALPLADALPAPLFIPQQLEKMPKDKLPERIVWLDLPFVYGEGEYKSLLASYKVIEEKVYERQGYQLAVKIMQRL